MKKKVVWVVIALVLVGAALGYVFFSLFAGRNTAELAQFVANVTDTGYLSAKNTANTEMDAYLKDMATKTELASEKDKIEDYQTFFEAAETVGQFFRRQIVFTQYTKTYRDNRKKVQDNFSSAGKLATQLQTFINDTMEGAGSSHYWQASTWNERCGDVQKMMNQTADALYYLCEIYQTCVVSKLLNNDFAKVLFMAVQDALKDVKSADKTTGGAQLNKLAQSYMSVEGEKKIIRYNYNDTLKAKIEKIISLGENGKTSQEYQQFLSGTLA